MNDASLHSTSVKQVLISMRCTPQLYDYAMKEGLYLFYIWNLKKKGATKDEVIDRCVTTLMRVIRNYSPTREGRSSLKNYLKLSIRRALANPFKKKVQTQFIGYTTEPITLADYVAQAIKEDEKKDLWDKVVSLKPQQASLIQRRYISEETILEIATSWGRSRQRCSRVHQQAIEALRRMYQLEEKVEDA